MSGVATATSKSVQPPWMRCDQLFGADDVRAGRFGLARLVALGEGHHALGAASARGQDGRAAHQLVGVARVEAGANVQLDRLVELGERRSP